MSSREFAQPGTYEKAQLRSSSEIERTPVGLVHEIIEKNDGAGDLVLVGIRRRGFFLAQRIGRMIERIEKAPMPVGTLDTTAYRDDLSPVAKRAAQKTEIGFSITEKKVILVDHILYTGRTTRAALAGLFRHRRPKQVELCVLIDRGHRELPIEPTYVGRRVDTTDHERVELFVGEVDKTEKVLLMEMAV
jgi:pyrimidine operon attenuation protein / uracil phosphoribosyltransferase